MTPCSITYSQGGQCGAPDATPMQGICIHEHTEWANICPEHRASPLYCRPCHDAPAGFAHKCEMTIAAMPQRVVRVWTFTNNDMVMACDQHGQQVPAYQGRLADVAGKIRRDFPAAEWMNPFDYADAASVTRLQHREDTQP